MFTIHLSYPVNHKHHTKWHPTENVGPFAVLTRGNFRTELEAHNWAQFNGIHSDTYTVKLIAGF